MNPAICSTGAILLIWHEHHNPIKVLDQIVLWYYFKKLPQTEGL
jgi:hypothetical protein